MTDKRSSTLKIEGRPILMDVHPEDSGKIWLHEEIMVPLTEMNRDALLFQVNQTVNNRPESRINPALAAKPEIKKISKDKKMVDDHVTPGSGALPYVPASLPLCVSSFNLEKELQQGLIMGILLISKVGVRKKKTTQGSFQAFRLDFLNWDHKNLIAKIAKMINCQETVAISQKKNVLRKHIYK